MGGKASTQPETPPQQQMSEVQLRRHEADLKEQSEKQRPEEAFIASQIHFLEVAEIAAEIRRCPNEDVIAAQKKLQLEAAKLVAQKKIQEEAFFTAQKKLQEEAANLEARKKLQEEAFNAAQRILQVESEKLAAQRSNHEVAFTTAQKKVQEEAAKRVQQNEDSQRVEQEETAPRARQEEVAISVQLEEATRRVQQEEAARKAQQEEAVHRARQEEATWRAHHEAAALRAQQEASAWRAQQAATAWRAQQAAAAWRAQQEAAAWRAQQEAAAWRAQQSAAAWRAQQEAPAWRAHQEEAAKRIQQEEFAKKAREEEAAKKACQEEVTHRVRQEETAQRAQREEAAQRIQQEEATKRLQQEEATKRVQQEEATKKVHQGEAAKKACQEEVAQRVQQKEATRRAKEEEAAQRAQLEVAAKREQQKAATMRVQPEEAAQIVPHEVTACETAWRVRQDESARRIQQQANYAAMEKLQEATFIAAQKQRQDETAKKGLHEEAPKGAQGTAERKFKGYTPPIPLRTNNFAKGADVLRWCATCFTRSVMKMFECENGHGSCESCRNKKLDCGVCFGNRNTQTRVHCPNESKGCVLLIRKTDMEVHMKECPFKIQDCPLASSHFPRCQWKGEITELWSHFSDKHQKNLLRSVGAEMQVNTIHANSRRYVRLVKLGFYFIFHMKISEILNKVFIAVQLIGTKMSAKKCLYEVHVYNKSDNRRKYVYTDNCRSSIDDIEDVFEAGECAVLPMRYANTFIDNGVLTLKFFVKRVKEMEKRSTSARNQHSNDNSESEDEDNDLSGSNTSLTDDPGYTPQQPRKWLHSRYRPTEP